MRRNLAISSFQEWFTAYLGHCLEQPQADGSHLLKIVRSLGLTISQLAKDSALAVANFTLLRRDVLIADLPHNVKEEDRRKLRAGSFRGRDLFVPDVVDEADRSLKGFNAQQASINMMSLRQNASYSVGKTSTDKYKTNRDRDPPRMGRPPSLLLRGVGKGDADLTRSVKQRSRNGR